MAPKNRIVTLDDLKNPATTTNLRDDATVTASSSAGASRDEEFYCKPIDQGHAPPSSRIRGPIPLYEIRGLGQSDACRATLKRIHDEFFPIIQRRGYNVTSISEFCCCGDGLDSNRSTTGRKRRKMGNNVLGYNQTTTRGGIQSHSIHLRLRSPQNHQHQLFAWEEVAGTMAHELSHCIYHNHGKAFYKLMEDILEEHAVLQAQKMTTASSGTGPWHPERRLDHWGGASATATTVEETGGFGRGGNRLGGTTETSRLLGEFGTTGGVRLGGGASGRNLRDLVARAAESRQRQMLQIRKMIERSKEPCVIEIFDDEDEDENDDNAVAARGSSSVKTQRDDPVVVVLDEDENPVVVVLDEDEKPRASHRKPAEKKRSQSSNESDRDGDIEVVVLDGETKNDSNSRRPDKKRRNPESTNNSNPRGSSHNRRRAQSQVHQESSSMPQIVDLTATAIDSPPVTASAGSKRWSCGLCTYQNRAHVDRCEMCLSPR